MALAASLLATVSTDTSTRELLARWGWPLLFLPALFWFGSMIYLLPEESPLRVRLDLNLRRGLIPLALLLYLAVAVSDVFIMIVDGEPTTGPGYPFFAVFIIVLLLATLAIIFRSLNKDRTNLPRNIILVATLFFGLGIGLLLLPLEAIPSWLMVIGIGFDLALLGLAIAVFDAFGEGEALKPDFYRSFAFNFFAVLIFGGQVVLAMAISTGATFPMNVLLLAIIITAVFVQTFADPIQSGLDRFVFSGIPRIRQTRGDLRLVSSALPRIKETLDPQSLNEDQFARLIRRALSQMGNLPRLAASPLTRLGIIESGLQNRGTTDNTLERAAELKSILADSIGKPKPKQGGDHGISDSWRYYNALNYPYVVGVKPYSRRFVLEELDSEQQEVLTWFQNHLPERTLHNWQNSAAKLVAQNIRELSMAKDSGS